MFIGVTAIILLFTASQTITLLTKDNKQQENGLIIQEKVVKTIVSNEKNTDNYCVRIYTPPVIPHTYNYLFLYQNHLKKTSLPSSEWVNNSCWFIVEKDDFLKRKQVWLDTNNPKDASLKKVWNFKDVELIHYTVIIK